MLSNLFDEDGARRRVYAPYGRWGSVYLVPDEAAGRVTGVMRGYYRWMALGATLAMSAVQWGHGVLQVIGVVAALAALVYRYDVRRATRGLERLSIDARELRRVPYTERLRRRAKAAGVPILSVVFLLALSLAAMALWTAVERADPLLWFYAACFGILPILAGIQLWYARRA